MIGNLILNKMYLSFFPKKHLYSPSLSKQYILLPINLITVALKISNYPRQYKIYS